MRKNTVQKIIISILVIVIIISALNILKILHDYNTADDANSDLQERFVTTLEPTSQQEKTPQPKLQAPIEIDFDALLNENEDIIGWIYCPDTPINYPVVQGTDNNEYLRSDLYGKYLISGTVFVDYRNGNIGEDRNYIIYGHNMKNSTMFGTLVKYKEPSYYDTHPIIYFLTPEYNYIIELYAGMVVAQDSIVYQPEPDQAALSEFLNEIKDQSTFESAVEISDSDSIITLSTCSYEYDHARYIVVGKLTKI